MKFYIDGQEIKTVLKGAVIEGNLSEVSRTAIFSYVYFPESSEFMSYRARVGSIVLINNDDKHIFAGYIQNVHYDTTLKLVTIRAKDIFSILLKEKVIKRFDEKWLPSLEELIKGSEIFNKMKKFLKKKRFSIPNVNKLSLYDILMIFMKKSYMKDFKLFVDGDMKLNVLTPIVGKSRGDFVIGGNIISSSFSQSKEGGNYSKITAIGDDNVVSGAIIRVLEPVTEAVGYFVVKSDRHIYSDVHIMELSLKERKLLS